jgi:hypothetical protein
LPLGVSTKILFWLLIYSLHLTCPAELILFYFST